MSNPTHASIEEKEQLLAELQRDTRIARRGAVLLLLVNIIAGYWAFVGWRPHG